MKKLLFALLAVGGGCIVYEILKGLTPEIHTLKEWAEMPDRVSVKGKWYVVEDYRTDNTTNVPRFKFGDGKTLISKLPFCTAAITDNDMEMWDDKSV